ncbi:hypothetical protein PENTCL1PPCAC_23225, partial [Pristionchus entomophagus]
MPNTSSMGILKLINCRLMEDEEKRDASEKKKEEGKEGSENPPFDLPPYKANYEEKNEKEPDVSSSIQMERVEREIEDVYCRQIPPPQSTLIENPMRKRGRLAQLRRERQELEMNTKKNEEKKVLPVYNPYAAAFNGNMGPADKMEKIMKMREERERR